MTVVSLIIRTPTPLLQHKCPYEILFNKDVDYNFLCVFGCLTFASTLQAHRTRFQPRARKCVFLDYPPGVKGYQLLDMNTRETFNSRDVVFHERIFPFHSITSKTDTIGPFPDIVFPVPNLDSSGYIHDEHEIESQVHMPDNHTRVIDDPPLPHSSAIIPYNDEYEDIAPPVTVIPIRRSARPRAAPTRLQDYHCNVACTKLGVQVPSPHHISKFCVYVSLSTKFQNYVLSVSDHFQPQYYHQACKYPEWRDAMRDELTTMENNNT